MLWIYISYVVIIILAAYKDYRTYTVSRYTNVGILILSLLFDITGFPLHLLGAFLLALPFLCFGVKTNHMGGGDIKFIFVNGCFLGLGSNYTGIMIGFVLLIVINLIKQFIKQEKMKEKIALVPYLAAGYLIVIALEIYK